ncbi:MAG: ATP-dependent RecD-like DNA helicase [Syntrophomonadaceae bacterium]|nr:ATP-dependent RecD-like DNA helicase [Bacillota bacterium]
MRNGKLGVENLNTQLQARINPPSPHKTEARYGKGMFRTGDKVMQIRNNYQKEIFNGDIGRITGFNTEDMIMFVRYADAREIEYNLPRDLDELVLSYAITVHKSQGGEYPVIVVPVSMQHYIMLQRNLIYTAITRAKELVVAVGEKKALAIAVKNNKVRARYTNLKKRLRGTAAQQKRRVIA